MVLIEVMTMLLLSFDGYNIHIIIELNIITYIDIDYGTLCYLSFSWDTILIIDDLCLLLKIIIISSYFMCVCESFL